MSDFNQDFWSLYIAGITLLGVLACLVLLIVTAKKTSNSPSDNTTGHVWDEDLREMNNPLPLWWVGLFVMTVIFALVYLFLYPGLGHNAGAFQWSSRTQYTQELAKSHDQLKSLYARYDQQTIEQLAKDTQAMGTGENLFMNNCAQCHGSDARGFLGFPNLTDKDWLHGGTPDKINESITQGRIGNMPSMAAAVGTPQDIDNLAHYVLSLSGSPHDSVKSHLGKDKFTVCAACHGADGKGNTALGAPNLTDTTWLHGWGTNAIKAMVNQGKINVMPAQKDRLTASQIHVLTAYVWGMSH